jgi:hypothetical protein
MAELFGDGADFSVAVFGLAALAAIGFYLLFQRISDTAKRRRSLGFNISADAVASVPIASTGAPQGQAAGRGPAAEKFDLVGSLGKESPQAVIPEAARLEIQLRDANYCLFMVLMDCCNMISEVGEGSSGVRSDAFTYATNIRQSGRNAMSNKEIADHAYQLAAELRPFNDPATIAIRRVLTQLTTAERWEATVLSGGGPFEKR